MLAKTLRDDQATVIGELRDRIGEGERRIVVQAPTGFGKGIVIADIVDRARYRGKNVLITVPTIALVDQTVEVIYQQGARDIGVIQAKHSMTDLRQPVQVASVQTLQNRWRDRAMPQADLVLIDEVHIWYDYFGKWLCDVEWENTPIIGFSATPWRKGLGAYYRRLITGNTIDDLIAQKVLVPYRTFAPDMPDLSAARVSGDEFVTEDIEEAMRPKKLVANIVASWQQFACGRPTVAFCCTRAHADQVAKEFRDAGIGAGYLDCETPQNQRTIVRNAMLRGEIEVVCNVDIVGIGVDWPEVSCIIYARPTMSDMRFVQNVGRGLRACEGKDDLLILDHSTTTARLGFVGEVYGYHRKLDDGRTKPKAAPGVALPKPCPKCFYMKAPRTAKCPNCGHVVEHHAEPVLCERGTLREYKPGDEIAGYAMAVRKAFDDRACVWGQLVWWQQHKGYKPGWVNMKFGEIYGVKFPRDLEWEDKVESPTPELMTFLFQSAKEFKRQKTNEYRRGKYHQRKQEERSEQALPKDWEDYR